jgi:hypothetical protein
MALDNPVTRAAAQPRDTSLPRFLPLRWFRKSLAGDETLGVAKHVNGDEEFTAEQEGGESEEEDELTTGEGPRPSTTRTVVPGLPRAQTFKRQQSEVRTRLEPHQPSQAERRAVSMDRRGNDLLITSSHFQPGPRASAPDFAPPSLPATEAVQLPWRTAAKDASRPRSWHLEDLTLQTPDYEAPALVSDLTRPFDTHSMTTSQFDEDIRRDLEKTWILNLSMHFRDKSRREKFFVTYCQPDGQPGGTWRRVTISLDYRQPPPGSLEEELVGMHYQRDKSAKIYEAIRESLKDIQFYDTVTNLKLETKDARLHVHVVEDVNVRRHRPF